MNRFRFNYKTKSLFKAVLALNTAKEAEKYFRDLCTPDEIEEMAERWQIVKLLNKKNTYREIAEKLNVSTTTVSRVAFWLNNGTGGYDLILNRLNHHHSSARGKS